MSSISFANHLLLSDITNTFCDEISFLFKISHQKLSNSCIQIQLQDHDCNLSLKQGNHKIELKDLNSILKLISTSFLMLDEKRELGDQILKAIRTKRLGPVLLESEELLISICANHIPILSFFVPLKILKRKVELQTLIKNKIKDYQKLKHFTLRFSLNKKNEPMREYCLSFMKNISQSLLKQMNPELDQNLIAVKSSSKSMLCLLDFWIKTSPTYRRKILNTPSNHFQEEDLIQLEESKIYSSSVSNFISCLEKEDPLLSII
jgi:hypothetical protein